MNKVKKWGLSLSKQKDPEGRWPGKRSEHLFEVDKQWNQNLVVKNTSYLLWLGIYE